MTKLRWWTPVVATVFAAMVWLAAGSAAAADRNKCGCYKNAQGTCFCDKKAKCGCPGDCEPKGCEAAREKALQKEIEAETRKAAQSDKKHVPAKASGGDKSGGDKGGADKGGADKGGKESSDEGKSSGAGGKKLTPAQTKQLVKLLDQYFQENPDARSRNVEEVRNQLSQSR